MRSTPEANQTIVEGELAGALRRSAKRASRRQGRAGDGERVLLLRAAPEWRGPDTVTVPGGDGREVTAEVRGCSTVLAVLDALAEPRDSHLVILTGCDDTELGRSVLAQAFGNEVRPINRWDLVAEAFGARRLDPRLGKDHGWLAEALLDAQPRGGDGASSGGWRRLTGPLLQLDTALRRLTSVRFGLADDERLDAAALLEWTRDDLQVARFLELRDEERAGIIDWLRDSIGPVADVVFRLLGQGQTADALPFGLAAAVLYAPAARRQVVVTARVRAEERFLGGHSPSEAVLRAFAEAAESLTLRWNDNGHAREAQELCDRGEQILGELRAEDLAADSKVLDAGLDGRLTALAETITAVLPTPGAADLADIESALTELRRHRRYGARAQEVEAAVSAVRLVRWLVEDESPANTVAAGVNSQVRSWGWVDRATDLIWNPDTARVPQAQAAYETLYAAVREGRAELDREFAQRLAGWSPVAGPTEDLLLAENVLSLIARPVAERAAPLIIVLDGMSVAVATELAGQLAEDRGWTEVGRDGGGREGALATLPSATRFSRTSLLRGELMAGGQAEERAGFTAFWRGRRTALFHKADLDTGAGARLPQNVIAAINDSGTVVGVVLNTIDDRLRDDRRVSDATWRLDDVDYLPELLRAAATVGRPVILASDHGHVLDRGDDIHPATGDSARYRTGPPAGDGELSFAGPRVLTQGESVTMPWDVRIRYLPRKAGYHGGASPAEMVIPVLIFVRAESQCPKGWVRYENPKLHEPSWWNGTGAAVEAPAAQPAKTAKRPGRKPPKRVPAQESALFEDDAIVAESGIGARVVGSELFDDQRVFVRKAPPDEVVAALIDGLVSAGGKLPMTVAGRLVGQPPFRMAGFLAQVVRLLNVDGYPVVGEADGGRTVELNVTLLTEQFLGTG